MAKITAAKRSVKTLGDDELITLFEEAFKEQVASYNQLDEFEVKCIRTVGSDVLRMEVVVQGMAGCPTAEDFKKGKVTKANTVSLSRDDKTGIVLTLLPKETVYLNSTEYIIVYQST